MIFGLGQKEEHYGGGATGLVSGAIVGGVEYFGRVKDARQSLMTSGVDPNGSIEATDASLNKFVRQNTTLNELYEQAGYPKMSVATADNIPSAYSLSPEGLLVSPDGNLAGGIASPLYKTRSIQTGSIRSEITIAPRQFSKALKLYMTAGHELVHARDFYVGNIVNWGNEFINRGFTDNLTALANYRSEISAHTWSYNTAKFARYNAQHYKKYD